MSADRDELGREEEALALQEAISVGRTRLTRTFPEILATGLVGGIDVSLGVAALLIVEHETGSRLLGPLAFTIGFIALILGKKELFDENYLAPVAAVVADKPGFASLLRLWAGMATMNLVGCWIFAGLTAASLSPLHRRPLRLRGLGRYGGLGRHSEHHRRGGSHHPAADHPGPCRP